MTPGTERLHQLAVDNGRQLAESRTLQTKLDDAARGEHDALAKRISVVNPADALQSPAIAASLLDFHRQRAALARSIGAA